MGSIAAIITAFCWTLSPIFFTSAGRLVGSASVNRIRLAMAVFFLSILHLVINGSLIPGSVEPERLIWLSLSAIAGLVLGDSALFQAYIMIGPRLGTLIMATNPVIGAILAWVILGEHLGPLQITGIVITMGGIALVVLERTGGMEIPSRQKHYAIGVLLALVGALGQAGGLVLAKKGLGGGFSALSGVLIRMTAAMLVIWLITLLLGKGKTTLSALRQWTVTRPLLLGALIGPVFGVWLSFIAVQSVYVGIASTLMALNPIFILPIAHWVYKESISKRAVIGTVITMLGLAIIFLIPG